MGTKQNASLAGEASVEHEHKASVHDRRTDSEVKAADLLAPILARVDRSHHWRVHKKPAHVEEPLGRAQIATHLDGGPARGACPIRRGESTTRLALLDLDSHKDNPSTWDEMADAAGRVMTELERRGLKPRPFRSRNGEGIHLFMPWNEPQDAYSVRALLADAIVAAGFRKGTTGGIAAGVIEIFPKQDEVPADGCGNMFVLPFAGKSCPLHPLDFDPLPVALLAWRASDSVPVLERPKRTTVSVAPPSGDLAVLKRVLARLNPDTGYDDDDPVKSWLKVGMLCHHETGGAVEGLDLWEAWSNTAIVREIASREKHEAHYRSFGKHSNPITLASYRHLLVIDEFDVLTNVAESNPVGDVPESHLPNTDQANAHRIRKRFSEQIISVSGRFHFWSGTHWAYDEGAAARCAASLSGIVKVEAKRARSRADELEKKINPDILKAAAENPRKHALNKTPEGAKLVKARALVETLKAWQKECEMSARQKCALDLLRRMLTRDPEQMDADPWLLNCLNGTVDLRTGELRPHSPGDWITKLAPVEYDPDARADRFEQFMYEISAGDAPMGSFLQRWFGYCATASVREQKFVVHIGQGANGKGTLLEVIASVLGAYAGTAAPGLLAGGTKGSERHPTEIAELFGLRMVTAHESDEGAVLREGFIKQLTGGDRLKGRWMRKDFFEFPPTHKVQLLTNHKPQIKGQDFAIWRRVLLVPYPIKFGTAEDLADGKVDALRNDSLPTVLSGEREGVLRWIVEGAVQWFRDGLNPPDCVVAAGAEYRAEQDRVGEFVRERCELGREYWAPISGAFGGVYSAYMQWCRESGYQALGKSKFLDELERVAFTGRATKKLNTGEGGKRRDVAGIFGLRLLGE